MTTTTPSVHLTWSIERTEKRGGEYMPVCPCGGDVLLVVAPDEWADGDKDESIPVFAEVSAHVCNTCQAVVSISVNIDHYPKS